MVLHFLGHREVRGLYPKSFLGGDRLSTKPVLSALHLQGPKSNIYIYKHVIHLKVKNIRPSINLGLALNYVQFQLFTLD